MERPISVDSKLAKIHSELLSQINEWMKQREGRKKPGMRSYKQGGNDLEDHLTHDKSVPKKSPKIAPAYSAWAENHYG